MVHNFRLDITTDVCIHNNFCSFTLELGFNQDDEKCVGKQNVPIFRTQHETSNLATVWFDADLKTFIFTLCILFYSFKILEEKNETLTHPSQLLSPN